MPRTDVGASNNKSMTSTGAGKEPPRLSSYLTKKSSTKPVIDTTSVTSTSSHQPDVVSVFQKKPNVFESSTKLPPTTTTASAAKKSGTAAATTKPKLDPWEWHDKLVSNETKRAALMEQRYQAKQVQYAAMQQLVTDAIQETSLAYRWTTSITKIQDEFAQSLTLKETMNLKDHQFVADIVAGAGGSLPYDLDDPEKLYDLMVETVTLNDTLPEKVRKPEPANGDEEATENSLAGSFNIDHERNAIHEVAVIVTTTNAPKRNPVLELLAGTTAAAATTTTHAATNNPTKPSSKNDLAATSASSSSLKQQQPPVFAISFPNPFCCHDAYYILHKQHEFLQQTLSRSGVNQSSIDKIQQMKELAQENESKLHELAGTILQDWKVKEEEIKKKWNNYLSIALEVLSSVPRTTPMPEWPKSTDAEQKMKYTTGDVWIAEILYRTAVKRQEINFLNEEVTLQSLCEMVKDGEYQRRTRLRKHIQLDVLQKHASIFDKVQLAHTEALESYLSPTTTLTTANPQGGFADEYKYLENDSFQKQGEESTKKDHKKKKPLEVVVEKKKMSIKEQIQEIATFIGTTTVWDPPNVTTDPNTPLEEEEDITNPETALAQGEEKTNDGVVAEIEPVDVDMYVGSFDEDEEGEGDEYDEELNELPLLKDAIIDPYTIAGSPGTSRRRKKQRKRKSKPVVMKDMVGLQPLPDDKFKIQNPVVLDQQSLKHAVFMDQLLFTGSLLESHYVQYASVVGLDDNYSSYLDAGESKSSKKDDASSTALNKHGLVIITSDDILHLFEIPTSPTISSNNSYVTSGTGANAAGDDIRVVPGCNPEDAMNALLKQNANSDLVMKEQQDMQALLKVKTSPVSSSPSKLSSFLRTKAASTKEVNKCFQFHNMAPSLSMPLSECTVRQSLNGQSSVRISHNAVNPRIASNKLIFATAVDQNAFLTATRTDVTLWDLK